MPTWPGYSGRRRQHFPDALVTDWEITRRNRQAAGSRLQRLKCRGLASELSPARRHWQRHSPCRAAAMEHRCRYRGVRTGPGGAADVTGPGRSGESHVRGRLAGGAGVPRLASDIASQRRRTSSRCLACASTSFGLHNGHPASSGAALWFRCVHQTSITCRPANGPLKTCP